MLAVRGRSLLPLLRRGVRPTPSHTSYQRSLAPLHLPPPSSCNTRSFSRQNDNSETLLHRLTNSVSEAARTLAQEARGADMTDDEATILLSGFAKQRRTDDCIGLLRYCREQNVQPEISARSMAFRMLCDSKEFAPALQLFSELSREDAQLKPWMVGRALEAATKAKRLDVVTDIFHKSVGKKKEHCWTGTSVYDLVREAGDNGHDVDEFALRSIAIFADRAGDADLAMEMLTLMKKEMEVTADVYASVLEACGKAGRWGDLVIVYEEMPKLLREKLYSRPLGLVVRAHTRTEQEDLIFRGLKIFNRHQKGKWSVFPCDAALEALLQTQRFDKVIALAGQMKRNDVKWSGFTYKMVTLAHIGNGSAGKAKQMLLANSLEDGGVESYRELLTYFLKERRDDLQACQVYVDMMRNTGVLEVSDWINALEAALHLTDRSMYWHFRKKLKLCGKSTVSMIPSHLLLSVQDDLPKERNEATPQKENEQIEFTIPTDDIEASRPRGSLNNVRKSTAEEKKLSTLLTTFAKDRRLDECEELLRYCQEKDVSLDGSSRSQTFRSFCDAGRFEAALKLFDTLAAEAVVLRSWVYGRALEAAVNLNREDLVLFVFRRLLGDAFAFKNHNVEMSGKVVHAMMRDARDRGVRLSKRALRSLAIFADRSGEAALAEHILSIMQSEDMDIPLDVYGSVLNAYGLTKRWEDLLKLYQSMPEDLRSKLHGTSLSWVITATRLTDENQSAARAHSASNRRQARHRSAPVSDVSLVQDRFEEIRENGGVGLTEHTASTLMGTMSKHKRVYDCAEMLRYFNKQGVSLKPFAALSAFSLFCEAEEFIFALEVFENLYESTCVLKPWVFGWALDAATNSNRQDLVASIFQRLLTAEEGAKTSANFQVQPNEHGVYGMLFDVSEQGVNLSRFAFEALLSFADKASQSDLALDVLTMMHDEDMKPSVDTYGMVLVACGKSKQWGDVMHVFEEMPESFRSRLSSAVLGSVVLAHTQSGDDELITRGLELFDDHKAKWGTFACNSALEALLQLQKFEDLFTLANDMKGQKVKWSSFTYSLVTLGDIRCGSIDKARRSLKDNSRRMQDNSTTCYEELIEYFANTLGDTLEAVKLCEEMVQNNWYVSFSGWHTALKLSVELPDRKSYWKIRKQLWLRAEPGEQRIPSHLMLPERDNPRERGLTRQSLPADVSLAFEVFEDIWNAGGSGLTQNVATKLLQTMAEYQCVEESLEMLDYFQEHRVTPKECARVAAFRTLCDANEDGQALELLGAMLNSDVVLHARDCPAALKTAMKMKRHELVSKIVDHMRSHDTGLNPRTYDSIRRKYGCVEEWETTVEMLSTLVNESDHRQNDSETQSMYSVDGSNFS